MKVGIIGLNGAGKSSLFHALTGQPPEPPSGKPHRRLGRALVPDPRVDLIARLEKSVKITYAEVNFIDPDGFTPEAGKSLSSEMLGMVRGADLLTLVIRAFDDPTVMHPLGSVDGKRDIISCFGDLIISDLAMLEVRLQRVKKDFDRGKKELKRELETIEKSITILESDGFLYEVDWQDYEQEILDAFELLTMKHGMIIWNVSENAEFGRGGVGVPPDVKDLVEGRKWKIGASSLKIESELMDMEESDRNEFLSAMNLTETIRDRFLRAAYDRLGLITYYTGGPKEAAARAIKKGDTAYDAAGKIHSDIQRGFIRAEIMSFEDFEKYGTVDEVRRAGKYRLEKKEYVMQDGDIVIFRFNV